MPIFENFKNLGRLKDDQREYEFPLEGMEDQDAPLESKNAITFLPYLVVFLLIFAFFVGQLFKLQVVKGSQNQILAEGNRLRIEEIKSPRGMIFDNSGNSLVKNTALYNLEIIPADLPREKSDRIKIYETLKDVEGVNLNELIDKIEKEDLFSIEPIIVKSSLTREEAMRLEIKFYTLSGIKVESIPTREYPVKEALSQILGYIGKISPEELNVNKSYSITDWIGKTGLEQTYENYLRGQNGKRKIEVNSLGVLQRELDTEDPVVGNNLVTTLNLNLQKKAYELLDNKIKELQKNGNDNNIKNGVLIALDPQSGKVLAMVSIPSYDNNLFTKEIKSEDYEKLINDPEKPMLNRAIGGIYPSGSIIKPIIAAAGLDKGVISENTSINDPGEIKIGEWSFPDWKNHGVTDVKKAIAESCNVFFYATGGGWENIQGLGVENIDAYLDRFGFGKLTGIEIAGEEQGTIPTPDWKEKTKNEPWYLGDTYHLSIGQGDFLTTPIEMISAISGIANGGKLMKPYLVEKVTDKDKNIVKQFESTVLNDHLVDNSSSIDLVRQGMRLAVDSSSGSARLLQELPVSSGGKTGTAQFDAADLSKTHAWFVAFAPYDNPEISIIVLVEKGGDGFNSAEPVAKDLLKYYFTELKK